MTAPATGSAAPDDALVERFRQALDRLWPEGGRLGLAVSGGPDSLALLLLAEVAIPGRFEVATVDHGLRPESAGECAWVQELCRSRAIGCTILKVAVGAGNVQSEARAARYRALSAWAGELGLTAIATGHHADDQAETLLMRLNRGSGVAGLAGVRERGLVPGTGMPAIRPLLTVRRADLRALVLSARLTPIEDPSNAADRFDRARLRKALAGNTWLDPLALVASASHLADADEAIAWAAEREWTEQVDVTEHEVRYRRQAPRAVALRVIARAVAVFGSEPRGQDVGRLLERLEAGAGGNLAGVLARVQEGGWVFTPEPTRRA